MMLKNLKYCFLFILMSCTSSKVITDYDKNTDFSAFKTYNLYSDIGKGLNELDVKRITKALDIEFKQLGFLKVEEPDFLVNIIVNYSEAQNNNSIGVGIGSGGRNGGFGISGGIPIGAKKLNEEFVVEFVNAKSDALFWEGVLNSKVRENRTPDLKEIHFSKVIQQILEKYPNKKSSKN